jgi:hypothetical protein
MEAIAMSTVVDYQPVKRPIGERINFRMLTIVLVFTALVGVPVYNFVKAQLTHGIEKDGDLLRVDLKSMGNFPFNDMTGTLQNVPADYRKLDGQRVALEGFMVPLNQAGDKIDAFQFVYNIQKCCFGGPPLVQERVFSFDRHGGIDYSQEEIRIIGTLHVKPFKNPTGKIESLYTMDVDHAEPL